MELFPWLLQFLGFGRVFFPQEKVGKAPWKSNRSCQEEAAPKGGEKSSKIPQKSWILLRFWGLSLGKEKFGNKSGGVPELNPRKKGAEKQEFGNKNWEKKNGI